MQKKYRDFLKSVLSTFIMSIAVLVPFFCIAQEESTKLDKVKIDLSDLPSLQRGAKLFMNYCSGCHSLKYIRFSGMAKDIGIVDSSQKILDQVIKDNLLFVGEKVNDPIISAMQKLDGSSWFGVAPPDLSLVTRLRGADWVYTYLRSFYDDPKKPWGTNNTLFPDVAMPNVLTSLKMNLKPEEFDAEVADLVNFLVYAGDPMQQTRKNMGVFVLIFLVILFIFAWLLKREYWKDVH